MNYKKKFHNIQVTTFANCWFFSDKDVESVAMWKLYSNPNSVALKIKFHDFLDCLNEYGTKTNVEIKKFIIGAVDYVDFQDPQQIEKIKSKICYTPFLKDQSFTHENEIRIIAEIEQNYLKPLKIKDGISSNKQMELHKLIPIEGINIILNNFLNYKFEVVFHPQNQEWVKQDIKRVLDRFELPFDAKDSLLKLKL